MNNKTILGAGIGVALFLTLLILFLVNVSKTNTLKDTITQKDKEVQSLNEKNKRLEESLIKNEGLIKSLKRQKDSLQFMIEGGEGIEVEDNAVGKTKAGKSKKSISGVSTVKYKSQRFDTYVVNARKSNLFFEFTDEGGNIIQTIGNLKDLYKQKGEKLLFATNGGIFQPDYNPEGLYVEGGEELFPLNLKEGNGNFYLKPNGVFYINKWDGVGVVESSDFKKIADKVEFATQSGPLLLLDGKVHPKFNKGSRNLRLRSGVGIIDRNTAVFIISHEPVNFYDFAMLF